MKVAHHLTKSIHHRGTVVPKVERSVHGRIKADRNDRMLLRIGIARGEIFKLLSLLLSSELTSSKCLTTFRQLSTNVRREMHQHWKHTFKYNTKNTFINSTF